MISQLGPGHGPWHRVPDPAATTTSGSLIGFEMEKLDQVALDAAAKMLCKINKENIAPAGPKQNRGAWSEEKLRPGTSCTRCLAG